MKQNKEIIEKILNSDDGLSDIIKKEIEEEERLEKEKASYNKEDFNCNNKDLKKSKYFSQLEKEADIYLKSERIPDIDRKKVNLNNIHKPIIKLLIVFIIAMIFVKYMQPSKDFKNIEGLWLDDKNIYYEIYDERLEMNLGNESSKFYEGQITNLVKTDDGYIILAKGIKYTENKNGELMATNKENIVLTIKEYTNELQVKMIANLGGKDFEIVRCDSTKKTDRIVQ